MTLYPKVNLVSLYTETIKPKMIQHAEWKALDEKVNKLTRELEKARTELINWEDSYVMRSYYPTSED
jgi:hypothetical protein